MVDFLLINTIIGGAVGTIGGCIGIVIAIKQFQRTRQEDRNKFLAAQKQEINSSISAATKELKQDIGIKIDTMESTIRTRGEVLQDIQASIEVLQKDVVEIEKKIITYDLRFPELDKVKEEINRLRDQVYQLQIKS